MDAHGPRPWAELKPDLATPGVQEAARLPAGSERAAVVAEHGRQLLHSAGARAVVVILYGDGTAVHWQFALGLGAAAAELNSLENRPPGVRGVAGPLPKWPRFRAGMAGWRGDAGAMRPKAGPVQHDAVPARRACPVN